MANSFEPYSSSLFRITPRTEGLGFLPPFLNQWDRARNHGSPEITAFSHGFFHPHRKEASTDFGLIISYAQGDRRKSPIQ